VIRGQWVSGLGSARSERGAWRRPGYDRCPHLSLEPDRRDDSRRGAGAQRTRGRRNEDGRDDRGAAGPFCPAPSAAPPRLCARTGTESQPVHAPDRVSRRERVAIPTRAGTGEGTHRTGDRRATRVPLPCNSPSPNPDERAAPASAECWPVAPTARRGSGRRATGRRLSVAWFWRCPPQGDDIRLACPSLRTGDYRVLHTQDDRKLRSCVAAWTDL